MKENEANRILKEIYPNDDLYCTEILEKPNTDEEGHNQVSWRGYSTGIKYRDNKDPNLDTYLLAFDSTEYLQYLEIKELKEWVARTVTYLSEELEFSLAKDLFDTGNKLIK